jgi:peptidoglycan hydrolase CwlO-like protein
MKIRVTKPVSTTLTTKLTLIFVSILIAIAVPIQIAQKASADQYDDKIAALQQDIDSYNAQAAQLDTQANTLQSAVAALQGQTAVIQAQIDISQAKYDQLVVQIADTEKKIQDNQDALGTTIANMYVEEQITPIEMIASSKSISDYLDKQEYRSSVRDQLTSTIGAIKDLKNTLDNQKADVEKVMADQKSQKDTLVAKETEQQNLLESTKGQEATYQQMISDNQAKIAEARATQAAIAARSNNTGGYTLIDAGSLGDYPWNASNCPMVWYYSSGGADGDGGDGHGYGCRQCASYVAWRIAKETGIYPSWGNAVDFTAAAQKLFGVGDGKPHAGSIAVMDPASAGVSEGHVAWVETDPYVNSSGQTVIQVSQYNFDYGWGYGMYSRMELSVNFFDHYVQIAK